MKIIGILLIILGALLVLFELGMAGSESYLLADPTCVKVLIIFISIGVLLIGVGLFLFFKKTDIF